MGTPSIPSGLAGKDVVSVLGAREKFSRREGTLDEDFFDLL